MAGIFTQTRTEPRQSPPYRLHRCKENAKYPPGLVSNPSTFLSDRSASPFHLIKRLQITNMDASNRPKSILIVGSGSFGLSTAHSLAKNDVFKDTKIILIDRWDFPAPDGASVRYFCFCFLSPDLREKIYSVAVAVVLTQTD